MTQVPHTSQVGIIHEAGQLFRLAWPLMGAQLAQMSMGIADAIMAGQYSSTDLAGVALGGSVLWPVMLLIMGLVQAVTPTVSQLNGAGDFKEIGEVIRQGLWLALVGGITASLILSNIGHVYALLEVDPAAAEISVPYLQMCAMGMPGLMLFFCLRFLADGMGFTRPALLIAITALSIKIPLNYVLIYGKFGLPEMGGVGCGVAQMIVMWFQFILILIVVTRKRFAVTGWLEQFSPPDWQRIKALLIIGIPIGLTIFAEVGLFAGTTLLLGQFGASVVASHNIAMNINGAIFMIPMALGMAATIRIGYRVGGGEIVDARQTAYIAMGTTVVIAALGSLFILVSRHLLVGFYTSETSVSELSASLLLFVVYFLILDATQTTAVGSLRGYKDTRVPMMIAMFSYWVIGLPMECLLGFGIIGDLEGVQGFWIGLATGVGTAAVLLSARLWWVSHSPQFIKQMTPRQVVTEQPPEAPAHS